VNRSLQGLFDSWRGIQRLGKASRISDHFVGQIRAVQREHHRHAQSIDIRGHVRLLRSVHQFRHRVHSTSQRARSRSAGGVHRPHQIKIRQLGAMELIQHDVRGLDIPMNDLLFVGELERFTHRRNYRQSVRSRNTVLEDRLMEIATRQIFHDEEEVTFLFEPFFEHLNDAGMMQCRHLARTPEETLATGAIIGVLPVQHLDRHHCMTLPVETFLNGRKAAMPQAFEQSEMAIQQKICPP
jgi:hypothetical protein